MPISTSSYPSNTTENSHPHQHRSRADAETQEPLRDVHVLAIETEVLLRDGERIDRARTSYEGLEAFIPGVEGVTHSRPPQPAEGAVLDSLPRRESLSQLREILFARGNVGEELAVDCRAPEMRFQQLLHLRQSELVEVVWVERLSVAQ